MAGPLLSPERAQQAFDLNLIRQDQLDKMFPPTTAEPPPEPDPAQAFMDDPMADQLAPQRAFWAQKKAKDEAAVALAEQRRIDQENADINKKRQIAATMGVPQPAIDAQIPAPGFTPPVNTSPIPTTDDPYLTSDSEEEVQRQLMADAALNYPGAAGYDIMRQGIESQGRAMREHSRAQALEYQKAMDAMEDYNKDDSIQNIAQNTRSEAALKDLETMRSDLASTKIEPRNLLGSASTGDKILAWTALVLGGIGGGGRNSAADALNRAVDRDIDAQKAQYQTKREGFENKQTIYGQMMDKYKNERAAREASKLGIYKIAELNLARLGARYTDAATQGKVQEQLGKLQLLQDQAKAEFMNAFMGDDPYKNLDEKQAARLVPGYGFAPDPKLKDLAVAATSMADNTISSINTILTKAKTAGRFDLGENDEIGQLVQLLRSESREAILGPGTVQEAERALIADMIKNPGAFFTNRVKAQKALEVVRDAAARTRDNKLKSFGVRPRGGRFRSLEYDK